VSGWVILCIDSDVIIGADYARNKEELDELLELYMDECQNYAVLSITDVRRICAKHRDELGIVLAIDDNGMLGFEKFYNIDEIDEIIARTRANYLVLFDDDIEWLCEEVKINGWC